MRRLIKRIFDLYDISDLATGAHCGACGNWMEEEIVPKDNTWSLCKACIIGGN